MRANERRLGLCLARGLAEQFRFLQCGVTCQENVCHRPDHIINTGLGRTLLDKQFLVVHNSDVFFGQVLDLTVLDFPKFFSHLRDQTYTGCSVCYIRYASYPQIHTEIVRHNHDTTTVFLDCAGKRIN